MDGRARVVGFVCLLRTLHVVTEIAPCRDAEGTRYKDELRALPVIGDRAPAD